MSKIKTDVAIIGAGPGGYSAAIRLAELGKKVVLIDKGTIGGVCLHRGCIPTKALVHAAEIYDNLSGADDMGISAKGLKIDFKKTQAWKDKIIKKLDGGVRYLLKNHDITLIEAEASFSGKNTLSLKNAKQSIESEIVEFEDCIIATGSRPRELEMGKFDGNIIISSKHAINLDKIPKTLLVIGGGYIGVEISQIYARLGCKVTIVEALQDILADIDEDIRKVLKERMREQEIEILTNAKLEKIDAKKGKAKAEILLDDKKRNIAADKVLVAVGRVPLTENIGLDKIGLKAEKGFIKTNNRLKTSVDNIYAIGDITGRMMLAHNAAYQGKIAAEVISGKKTKYDNVVPYVIYSDPEIAGIGLTEKSAVKKGIKYKKTIMKAGFLGKQQIMGAKDSIIKVLHDKNKILGLQVIGPESSNIIGEVALAMQNALGLEAIASTIHPHPTIVEALAEMAELALGKPTNAV